jgi:phosphoribosylglycinamide formyltransferase-1
MTVRVAVLASGRGTNFKALIEAVKEGRCDAQFRVLITNNPDAPAIAIAKQNGIPVEIVRRSSYATREEMDEGIRELLDRHGVDLVVLAGYMLLIKGRKLLEGYRNRIINIHPALLPAFPGVDAQKQAYDYGSRVSGLTIHFVDEHLDAGPVIYQEAIDISGCRSADEVARAILAREHEAYAKIVDSFSKGRYVIEGRHVRYVPSS